MKYTYVTFLSWISLVIASPGFALSLTASPQSNGITVLNLNNQDPTQPMSAQLSHFVTGGSPGQMYFAADILNEIPANGQATRATYGAIDFSEPESGVMTYTVYSFPLQIAPPAYVSYAGIYFNVNDFETGDWLASQPVLYFNFRSAMVTCYSAIAEKQACVYHTSGTTSQILYRENNRIYVGREISRSGGLSASFVIGKNENTITLPLTDTGVVNNGFKIFQSAASINSSSDLTILSGTDLVLQDKMLALLQESDKSIIASQYFSGDTSNCKTAPPQQIFIPANSGQYLVSSYVRSAGAAGVTLEPEMMIFDANGNQILHHTRVHNDTNNGTSSFYYDGNGKQVLSLDIVQLTANSKYYIKSVYNANDCKPLSPTAVQIDLGLLLVRQVDMMTDKAAASMGFSNLVGLLAAAKKPLAVQLGVQSISMTQGALAQLLSVTAPTAAWQTFVNNMTANMHALVSSSGDTSQTQRQLLTISGQISDAIKKIVTDLTKYPTQAAMNTAIEALVAQYDSQRAAVMAGVSGVVMTTASVNGALNSISPVGLVNGWAVDLNQKTALMRVDLFVDGPVGVGAYMGSTSTGFTRVDIQASLGYGATSGFSFNIKPQFFDGKAHTLYTYAVNPKSGGAETILAGSPMTFQISPLPTTPIGKLENISSDGFVTGWAADSSQRTNAVRVDFLIDGTLIYGQFAGSAPTKYPRPDVQAQLGYGANSGFKFQIPSQYFDGKTHVLHVFAVNPFTGGSMKLISGAPLSFKVSGQPSPSANIDLFIFGNINNFNVLSASGTPTVPTNARVTVQSGVTVGSTTSTLPAMQIGAFPSGSKITLVNNGLIGGAGGNGGQGPTSIADGYAGSPGGPGLLLNYPVTIANNGYIAGGGGGGGGGVLTYSYQIAGNSPPVVLVGTTYYPGGGGGGAGTTPGYGGYAAYPGANGTTTAGGNGGASPNAGSGGYGGGYGQAGGAGGGPWYDPQLKRNMNAGAGGAAGAAVITNGVAVTWSSGGTSPNIVGPINSGSSSMNLSSMTPVTAPTSTGPYILGGGNTSVPPTPTGLTILKGLSRATSLTLTWNPAGGSTTNYYVAVAAGSVAPSCNAPGFAWVLGTTFTKSGLSTNTIYTFSLCAVNSAGTMSPVAIISGTPPPFVIQTNGTTSFTQVNNNYYLYQTGTTTGPAVFYNGAPLTVGQFAKTPIGAVKTPTGYLLAFADGRGQYTFWTLNASGAYVSNTTELSGTNSQLMQYEITFGRDFNGDAKIGPPPILIRANGSTSLTQYGSNLYLYQTGTTTGPAIVYNGAPITINQFLPWNIIGAVKTATGYELAFKDGAQNVIWSLDPSGVYVGSSGAISGTSLRMIRGEVTFGQDLNGDGLIGPKVIRTNGSTSFALIGNTYYLFEAGTTNGPQVYLNGAPLVVGQAAPWSPIGAVKITNGYYIAWTNGAGQNIIWYVNTSGVYVNSPLGATAGTDPQVMQYEVTFGQDLNGDGKVGLAPSIIRTNGSTDLAKLGSNLYLYQTGTTTGPAIVYNGAPITINQFLPWNIIGAVKTATGYELAFKDGAQNVIWSLNSSGVYVGSTGAISGTSLRLLQGEMTFGQDLNGDGLIGPKVIRTNGSTSFALIGNTYYLFEAGTTNGPQVYVYGAPLVVGQAAPWNPIGAVKITNGYYIAWTDGAGQNIIWYVNTSGVYVNSPIGPIAGTDPQVKQYEVTFGQDINGDGRIGP